jgi:hypothetical protein
MSADEKYQLRLWRGTPLAAEGGRYVGLVFSQDYATRPEVTKALPALRREHRDATTATVQRFTLELGFWMGREASEHISLEGS